MTRLAAARVALGVMAVLHGRMAAATEQPVSAFAANVGKRTAPDAQASPLTIYVVPDGRMLLITDVLVANRGQESGILYLSDSHHTLCSVSLVQTIFTNNPMVLSTLQNPHVTFATGIPIGPGEPVIASLEGGTIGVDVTITGKLLPAARIRKPIVLPGGKTGDDGGEDRDASP